MEDSITSSSIDPRAEEVGLGATADDQSKSLQSDNVLITRFMLTLVCESLTIALFLIQDCGMGNPLLVQVMIVWPFFMGLTLLVFIVFNFIDNFIFDLPTAEEV